MESPVSDLSTDAKPIDESEESPSLIITRTETTPRSNSTQRELFPSSPELDRASRQTSPHSTESDSRVFTSALERGIEHHGKVLFEKYQYFATLNRLLITLTPIDGILRIKKKLTLIYDQDAMLNEVQLNNNPKFVFMATKSSSQTPHRIEMESTANFRKNRLLEVQDWKRAIYVTTKLEEHVLRNKITKSLSDQYEASRTAHVYQQRDIANHRYSLVQSIALKSNRTEFIAKTQLVARNPALAHDKPNILSEVQVLHEAVLTQVLEHPNIIKLWAINCQNIGDNLLDYTMVFECCAGGSLDDAIHNKDKKPLDSDVFEKIIQDVLSGLDFIHSKNIMHRDLKPANIGLAQNAFNQFDVNELGRQNLAKIMDFGLSKGHGPIIDFISNEQGAPVYMAPERLDLDSNSYDSSVDLYGTALIFYEMHTRIRPYQNSYEAANHNRNHFDIRGAIVNGTLRPNTQDFPPTLCRLIQGLWQNIPNDRWKAHECIKFLDFVTKYHGGEGVFAQESEDRVLDWSPTRLRSKRQGTKKGDAIVVKAIAVGDSGVGKTALGIRFKHAFDDVDTENDVKNEIDVHMSTTHGSDYTMVKMEPTNGTPTVMQILDTAGQERYNAITTAYYRNKQICFLVYDCSDPQSVYDESRDHPNKHRLRQYYDELMIHCSSEAPLLIVVIGNKRDLGDKSNNYAITKQLVDTFILDIRKESDKTKAIVLNPSPVSALIDGHATFQLILSDVSRAFAKSLQVPPSSDGNNGESIILRDDTSRKSNATAKSDKPRSCFG